MVPVIRFPTIINLRNIGRHMPRDRYQHGWIEETGKKVKKWKGHYYVYVLTVDGKEKRRHCSAILGLKSEMRKWEAERELAKIIEKETDQNGPANPDDTVTFQWFWENRYLPLRESSWRRSTKEAVLCVLKTHVLPSFGERRLCDLSRFDLQTLINALAKKYSRSVVQKARTWIKACLEEAVEQDFLVKNPARKLEMPITRKTCRRYLTPDEIQTLLSILQGRDRIVVRLFLLCALRPGELFALRWRSIEPGRLRIEEAVYRGHIGSPKTEGSRAYVALPKSLEMELEFWRHQCGDPDEDEFVFRSRRRTPLNGHNYRRRFLAPLAKKNGIEGLTFQCLRRTFATQFQKQGTVRDAQTQLRHSDAGTTMNIYTQDIPSSVRAAVEALDQKLCGVLNTIEHGLKM